MNNTFASKISSLQFMAIIVLCGVLLPLVLVGCSPRYPQLTHYFVTVALPPPQEDLQQARLQLEDSIFRSVNTLISQNQSLTYSQALDQVLPFPRSAGNSLGGAVIVIKNDGSGIAHNLQATINFGTPVQKYKFVNKGTVSVLDDGRQNGTFKITVDNLAPQSELQIAVIFSVKYEVFLTASRTDDLDRFLQFHVENAIDHIQPAISVSSDEVQSYPSEHPENIEKERRLFFETLQP